MMTHEEHIAAYSEGMENAYKAVRDEVEWLRGNGCLTERTEHAMTRAGVYANAESRDNVARFNVDRVTAAGY
jgi:hypothetical protein